MEGIFGILSFHGPVERQQLKDMALPLGQTPTTNLFCDGQFGMGVKRLPIVDRIQSPAPVPNVDKSLYVAINGEITNYNEIRRDMENRGHKFTSDSDAELVANLYLDRGDDFLRELNGLFAIAIWDRRYQEVVLAQDRYAGIRQLYYAQFLDAFVFASSIRPILNSGKLMPEVDMESLMEYFSIGRVLPPRCLFKGVCKMFPGHVLKCRQGTVSDRRIYGFSFTPEVEEKDVHQLERLFSGAMAKNVVADRPPAFLLSGGLDSSLNVAMASHLCDQSLHTISIRFSDAALDESPYSRLVAEHFKTNHHEYSLDSSNALEVLPQLVWCQEEPLSDGSALPSFHLVRIAKDMADVVIAGDGPDHLWGRAYNLIDRYRFVRSLPGHSLLRKLVSRYSGGHISKFYPIKAAQRLSQYADNTVENIYLERLSSGHGNASSLQFAPRILSASLKSRWNKDIDLTDLALSDITDNFRRLIICDTIVDGSFGVFSKFGKVAAGNSLLVREPYLDNELVDYIMGLPEKFKVRGFLWQRLQGTAEMKYLMRHDLGDKLLPKMIISKAKAGFTAPIIRWLREYLGQKKLDVDTLLSPPIKQAEFLDAEYIKNVIEQYRRMSWRGINPLYMLLLFVVWYRIYINEFNVDGPSVNLTELLEK